MADNERFIIGTSRTSGAENLFIAFSDFEGVMQKWEGLFKTALPESFVYLRQGWYSSIFNKKHLERIINHIKSNPKAFTNKLFSNFSKDKAFFRKKIKELKSKKDLSEFHSLYIRLFKHYALYIPVSRWAESAVTDLIKSKYPCLKEEEIFLLSKPGEFESTQRKYKKSLIKLAMKIERNDINRQSPAFQEEIKKMISAFGWIKSYIDFKGALTADELKDELDRLLSENKLKEEHEKFNEQGSSKKKKIIQKHNMNDYDLDDFDILEELAKIKTTVQDDQAYLSFTGKSNYENISSALGLSLDELKWLSHHEIAGLLAHQKVLSENTSDDLRLLIEKRKQGTKIFSLGAHAIHTTDKELAKKIFENKNIDLKKLFHEDIKEQTTITGISASPGRIIGKVKLVLYPDSYKQQHKEDKEHEPYDKLILVAHELTPDYTSLLGHADGVISDIGGLTSHTAVIARELNKPCIVGTKIATKLLKDGDFVEADADKGIVKILKK